MIGTAMLFGAAPTSQYNKRVLPAHVREGSAAHRSQRTMPIRRLVARPSSNQVTAELHIRNGKFESRLKHPRENHERVAAESDLSDRR